MTWVTTSWTQSIKEFLMNILVCIEKDKQHVLFSFCLSVAFHLHLALSFFLFLALLMDTLSIFFLEARNQILGIFIRRT